MIIKSGLGLAIAALACPLFAFGAGWCALQLMRGNRSAVVSTLPVVAEQSTDGKLHGELVVSVEVPRLSTDYRSWEVAVTEISTGQTHHMVWGGPRATGATTGFSTIKIPIGRLTLANPDALTFRIKGLVGDKTYSDSHVIVSRPYLARMAFQIVGIVLCAVGALLSLLGALWSVGVLKT